MCGSALQIVLATMPVLRMGSLSRPLISDLTEARSRKMICHPERRVSRSIMWDGNWPQRGGMPRLTSRPLASPPVNRGLDFKWRVRIIGCRLGGLSQFHDLLFKSIIFRRQFVDSFLEDTGLERRSIAGRPEDSSTPLQGAGFAHGDDVPHPANVRTVSVPDHPWQAQATTYGKSARQAKSASR